MAKIKYEIENQENGQKFSAVEGSSDWIEARKVDNTFGKPARWVKLDEASDFEKSREDDRKTVEVDEHSWEEIHVPADYTIVQTDVTAEEDQKELNAQKRKELAASDWKVIKHRDQLAAGEETSLSEEDYQALLLERKEAREAIIE